MAARRRRRRSTRLTPHAPSGKKGLLAGPQAVTGSPIADVPVPPMQREQRWDFMEAPVVKVWYRRAEADVDTSSDPWVVRQDGKEIPWRVMLDGRNTGDGRVVVFAGPDDIAETQPPLPADVLEAVRVAFQDEAEEPPEHDQGANERTERLGALARAQGRTDPPDWYRVTFDDAEESASLYLYGTSAADGGIVIIDNQHVGNVDQVILQPPPKVARLRGSTLRATLYNWTYPRTTPNAQGRKLLLYRAAPTDPDYVLGPAPDARGPLLPFTVRAAGCPT